MDLLDADLLQQSEHNYSADDNFVASLFMSDESNNEREQNEEVVDIPQNGLCWVDVEYVELPFPLFYDAQGKLLSYDQFPIAQIRKQFAFVVTRQQEVITRQFADIGVVTVRVDDKVNPIRYIPVKPLTMTVTKNGNVELTYNALKTDLELTLDDSNGSVDILNKHKHMLSLSCYVSSLRHFEPHTLRSRTNDGFEFSLACLAQHEIRMRTNHIGAWSRSQKIHQAFFDVHFFDVADLLEFYHVCSEWIWRSRLGFYVLNNYILPILSSCGNVVPNANVFAIINCLSFTVHQREPAILQQCNFCKRECMLKYRASLGKCGTFIVDEPCLMAMDVLFFITATLRNFRILANFEPVHAKHIANVLAQARERMHSLRI